MRIGVVSDSHGAVGRLSGLLMAMEAGGPLDAVIHLGDGYHDLDEYRAHLPAVYQVAGNCDWMQRDTEDLLVLSGARLLITHGHLYQVRQGTDSLLGQAIQDQAQAALYGHTHVPRCEWRNGILLLNPGAAQDGRYAILTINRLGAVDAQLFE